LKYYLKRELASIESAAVKLNALNDFINLPDKYLIP